MCRCARGSSPAVAAGNGRGGLAGDGTNSYSCTARGTPSSEFTPSGLVAGTFDAYGGQATAGTQSYAHDGLGRMTADVNTSTAAGSAFTYVGTTGTIASDGASACTWNPSGTILAGVGVPGGGTTGVLALTDSHGDVVGQFTASGTAVSGSAAYDPWGTVTATSGTLAGQLGFQSGWTDGATGKVAMGARWYSPSMGDFISADSVQVSPVPDPAMGNPFAYVGDSPLSSTDPTGHCGGLFSFLCSVMHAVAHAVHPVAHVVHPVARASRPAGIFASPVLVRSVRNVLHRVRDAAAHGARAIHTLLHQAASHTTRTFHAVARYASPPVHTYTLTAATGGGGPGAGHDFAVDIAENEIIVMMAKKYRISVMEAFNGIELGQTISGGSKYGKGKNGFADITFTRGSITEIWEVKSVGVSDPVKGDAQAVAAWETQNYIRAFNSANPGRRAIPGTSLPVPITKKLGNAGNITVFSPQALRGGPADGAILYASLAPIVPQPRAQPQAQPNYAPAAVTAGTAVGAGALLWWIGKAASPVCGPFVLACAVVF